MNLKFNKKSQNIETTSFNSINDILPNEILIKILQYAYTQRDSNVKYLMLVCRKWRNLMEYYYIFNVSNFFKYTRSEEDYLIAITSKRRFQSIALNVNCSNELKVNWLLTFLQKNSKKLSKCTLNYGSSKASPNTSSNNHYTTFWYFYSILKILSDIKELQVNFKNLTMERNPDDFKKPKLEFEKMREMRLNWKTGNIAIAKYFLNYISAPCLELFEMNLPKHYGLTESQDIFNFINANSENMKQISINCLDLYSFEWSRKSNSINICCTQNKYLKRGILQFLENQMEHIKTLKVKSTNDSNFIVNLLEKANSLKHFETDESVYSFCERGIYHSVKILSLWHFDGDSDKIFKIKTSFPNIEVIQFQNGIVRTETVECIQLAFDCIKSILY